MATTFDIQLPHYPRGFHLITRDILSLLPDLPENGLLVVFIKHTSAGILSLIHIFSGLFTLACFDNVAPDAVIAPFGAGCASIIYHPYREQLDGTNRAVLGSFDPSARKCMNCLLYTSVIQY